MLWDELYFYTSMSACRIEPEREDVLNELVHCPACRNNINSTESAFHTSPRSMALLRDKGQTGGLSTAETSKSKPSTNQVQHPTIQRTLSNAETMCAYPQSWQTFWAPALGILFRHSIWMQPSSDDMDPIIQRCQDWSSQVWRTWVVLSKFRLLKLRIGLHQ